MSLKNQRVVLFGLTSSYSVLLLMFAVCILSAPGKDPSSIDSPVATAPIDSPAATAPMDSPAATAPMDSPAATAATAPMDTGRTAQPMLGAESSQCDVDRPCRHEQVCAMGKCLDRIGKGGNCRGRECQAGLVCQDSVCREQGSSVPLACTDVDVVRAMRFMTKDCNSRPSHLAPGHKVDIGQFCSPADYAKLTLTDENFHTLMQAFHRTMITVNLPAVASAKRLRKNGEAIATGIAEQLRPYKAALQKGEVLVLVGRMDRDGEASKESRTITVSRTNLVEHAIRKVIGPGDENRDSSMFVLRPDKIIEPVQYKRNYAARSVGWDDASTRLVRELDTSSPDAAKVVARSVHIFIIPCVVAATEPPPA